MQRFRWLMCVAAVGFALEARAADETPAALDALLTAWSAASRNCRSLDTRFTVFYRVVAFVERTEQGRLYFEAPRLGRFQVGKDVDIVWEAEDVLYLMGATKEFARISLKEGAVIARRETELLNMRRSWIDDIRLALAQIYTAQPQDAIPCLLLTDVDSFRARYDLKLDSIDGKPWLTAKLKPSEAQRYSELQFIFNGATHLPEAVKAIRGADETVYVLYDTRLDEKPADRDQFLNPNLKGWRLESSLDVIDDRPDDSAPGDGRNVDAAGDRK